MARGIRKYCEIRKSSYPLFQRGDLMCSLAKTMSMTKYVIDKSEFVCPVKHGYRGEGNDDRQSGGFRNGGWFWRVLASSI